MACIYLVLDIGKWLECSPMACIYLLLDIGKMVRVFSNGLYISFTGHWQNGYSVLQWPVYIFYWTLAKWLECSPMACIYLLLDIGKMVRVFANGLYISLTGHWQNG